MRLFLITVFAILVAFAALGDAAAQSWQARHGLSSAQYQRVLDRLASQGYRLICVSGYSVNRQSRFAAIWERQAGPPWVARHDMTSAEYQRVFNVFVAQGYRLTLVDGYTVNGQDRYAAIWEQRSGPDWVARHRMTSSAYQQEVDRLVAQGFRLTHVSGYSVGNQDRYAAIWERSSSAESVARHGLTSSEYQATFDHLAGQGYTLARVSGYSVRNRDRYAAIWMRPGDGAGIARHRLTSAQYQRRFDSIVSLGYRLTWVNGYTLNGVDRYAAIWQPDSRGLPRLPPPPEF